MGNPADIPKILVALHFAIAPLLLLDALDGQTTLWFVTGYVIAILSDIFDGIIARRLGVSTPQLRQADSWADITLFGCIAASTWLVYPAVIQQFKLLFLLCVAAQLTLNVACLVKFRKFPCFHTYTAKAWGLTLLAATVALFGFGYADLIWSAIALCLINSTEEIIMTLLLPEWQCDVLSVFHAIAKPQASP